MSSTVRGRAPTAVAILLTVLLAVLLAVSTPGASSAFTAATASPATTTTATSSTWFRCQDAAVDARAQHRAPLLWSLQDGSTAALSGRGAGGAAAYAGGVWDTGTTRGSTTDGPCPRDAQTTGGTGRAVALGTSSGGAQMQYATSIAADAVLSVQLWFRTTTHQGLLVEVRDAAPAAGAPVVRDRVVFLDGSGRVVAGVAPSGSARVVLRTAVGVDWADGRWHHVALVQSPAGLRLYLDGQLRADDPAGSRGSAYTRAVLRVAQDDLSSWASAGAGPGQLVGDLAWFSAYQGELSAQEVLEQCRAGRSAQALATTGAAPGVAGCSA